jgi:hypothetical protein
VPDSLPAGQQTSTRTGTPTARASPAKPSQRLAGRAAAIAGSVSSAPTPPALDGSSPSPTTNEYAPEMGCESAETTR